MSFWRTKNSKKITSDSIAVDSDGTTLKESLAKTTLTLTMSSSNSWRQGDFYECNNIVHINGSCGFGSSTSTVTWNDIGIIPSGYRPKSEIWFPAIGFVVSGSQISGFYPVLVRITTAGLITMMCKTSLGTCIINAEWRI